MIVLFWSDGAINLSDVPYICQTEKWAPLVVFRRPGEEKPILPVFASHEIARKFSERNLPKDWLKGAITLSKHEIELIHKKEWILEYFNFPRKLVDVVKFGHEIIEFTNTPEYAVS